eukprot:gene6355-10361_t
MFICFIFIINGQQATTKESQFLKDLYLQDYFSRGSTRDKETITNDEAIKTRENQNRKTNANSEANDNFWNQLEFGDYLSGDKQILAGQIDEVDHGRDRTQLGARRNKGTSDKGRIQYQENAFTDSGNNYEDANENVKQNKKKFAGTLATAANLKGESSKDVLSKQHGTKNSYGSSNDNSPLLQSSLLSDYGSRDRYAFDDNFGSRIDFEDSNESFQGQKSGKKISNYDKTGTGKKLDHIYDKETWDNSELIYDNDKVYQRLKSTKLLGLSNQDVANKYGNNNQGEDHSRSSNSNDVGSSNSQQEGYKNRKHEKDFNQNYESGNKVVGKKDAGYSSKLEAKPSNYQ